MTPNAARIPGNEPADPRAFRARKHWLILALLGVSAIGISVLASNEPRVPATDTATPASKAPVAPASTAAKNLALGQIAGHSGSSADKPFDYFPAQFPTPRGDIGEQPPTF